MENNFYIKKIASYLAVLTLIITLSSCGDDNKKSRAKGDNLSGQISVSGAFALYPLAVQWAGEFQKMHPDVTIDLSAGGAGKGITDVLADQVDLGMVSRELKDAEVKKGALGFAVAKDAVVATINTNNPVYKDLLKKGFSLKAAQGLWATGAVKTWGQVVGNTNSKAINVYTRSDACGAAETWAEWIGKAQEDLLGTGVFGDPGVAVQIQKDIHGIGFNNIGYVYNSKTHKPHDGIAVVPIDINNNGKLDPDEKFYGSLDELIQAIADGKYPTPPARNLYLVTKGKSSNPVVVAFLKFILTKGQALNAPAGYIGISNEKLQKGLEQLK